MGHFEFKIENSFKHFLHKIILEFNWSNISLLDKPSSGLNGFTYLQFGQIESLSDHINSHLLQIV